jgi:hypothetical protein
MDLEGEREDEWFGSDYNSTAPTNLGLDFFSSLLPSLMWLPTMAVMVAFLVVEWLHSRGSMMKFGLGP